MFRTAELSWSVFLLFFQGLHLLQQAASLHEEANHLETAGLQKGQLALVGSIADGLYGLLQDVLFHTSSPVAPPPARRHQLAATATIAKPLSKSLKVLVQSPGICG